MAINWVLPVRGVQVTLSCVVLGLMVYVASWWTSHWRQMSPVEVNFMIFSPVWSLLALAALIVVPWKMPYVAQNSGPKIGLLVLELVTTLYWFGGFIALAVFLNDRICFGTVCSVAKAGTAISALNWVAWMATLVLGVVRLFFKRGAASGGVKGEPKVEMHQGV
ncbi:hypothetical protein K458DRAFT_400752 [Lentithecium fluviatile CBS 122367]|uniref:MARVEL domain-containing protein n=1 Tax=Lentithecium fluviatile CBS 122367 TaxID=1168545 RepID=A0A6G1JDF4_9PLEO|nr:hypothetical protein K458DRAFT_400752 [Lentithecium fluviatile CBS 122367]